MRVQHRLDVLAQSPRGEVEGCPGVARRPHQLAEPGPQLGGLHGEGAHLGLARGHVRIDALDDPAGIQLAAGKHRLLPLEMLQSAEAPADLVADVVDGRCSVEVADHCQVIHGRACNVTLGACASS